MPVALEQPGEEEVQLACRRSNFDRAATATLRLYGREVFGLLLALHKDRDAADDAFALFSERLWRKLRTFQWQSSLRTWVYRIARNCSIDVHREAAGRGRRQIPLSEHPDLEAVGAQVRTETLSILRTEKRAELEKLRDELADEDRLLLILRLDRDMAWTSVAQVIGDLSAGDDAALRRQAARLRKRFQLLKERLRETGKQRGLIA